MWSSKSYTDDATNKFALRLRIEKFNEERFYISDKDKDDSKEAYTDYGLVAGIKFPKDDIHTLFTMNRAELINEFPTHRGINLNDVIKIGQSNFKELEKPSV